MTPTKAQRLRLKQLHWDKIPLAQAPEGSLWQQLKASGTSAVHLDAQVSLGGEGTQATTETQAVSACALIYPVQLGGSHGDLEITPGQGLGYYSWCIRDALSPAVAVGLST